MDQNYRVRGYRLLNLIELISCRYDPYAADGEKKEDERVATEKGL